MKRQKYKTINLWFCTLMTVAVWATPCSVSTSAWGLNNDADIHFQAITYPKPELQREMESLVKEANLFLGPIVTQGEPTREESILPKLTALSEKAAVIHNAHPGTYYLKGMVARLTANNTLAEEFFLRALYQDPNNLKVLQSLIDLYTDQHQVNLAIPLMKQALDLEPDNIDTLYLLGKVFLEKNDPAKALIYFKQSETLDSQDRPKRLLIMAKAHGQLGQIAEATGQYKKLLSLWPNRGDIWFQYATLLEQGYDKTGALLAYQRAYALQPSILSSMIHEAETIFWTRSPREAFPYYYRIAHIAPEESDRLTLLVLMQYRLWLEGSKPETATLAQLEQWVRQQEQDTPSPLLQIADVQIQVMKVKEWTPGLQNALSQITQSPDSPYIQAIGNLMLNHPSAAQATAQSLGSSDVTKLQLQQLVLLGAWPWALRLASENENHAHLHPRIQAWTERELAVTNESLEQSRLFIKTQMTDQALSALHRAKVHHPLSAEVQLQYAIVYLHQNRLDEAKLSLMNATLLGLSPELDPQLTTLQQQLDKAIALKAKQQGVADTGKNSQ